MNYSYTGGRIFTRYSYNNKKYCSVTTQIIITIIIDCGLRQRAGSESVPEPKIHMPNRFPFGKGILLSQAIMVSV